MDKNKKKALSSTPHCVETHCNASLRELANLEFILPFQAYAAAYYDLWLAGNLSIDEIGNENEFVYMALVEYNDLKELNEKVWRSVFEGQLNSIESSIKALKLKLKDSPKVG
ncbi:MAG: hypothetical protein A3K09_02300 [Nitrospinae bacterium RIFCSPLOWO2_12_FULL_47_7]|nr:MAG: hypothetical protein A3K09_02300 [Nitrospinae bacterium RIFCSPLOWO2_12_FULL_47_7]